MLKVLGLRTCSLGLEGPGLGLEGRGFGVGLEVHDITGPRTQCSLSDYTVTR